jgi:hypothetical protein
MRKTVLETLAMTALALAMGGLTLALGNGTADAATSDSLTGLPLYPGAPFTMKLPNSTFCGVALQGTMYMPDGKIATIERWYAAHLSGFHFYHAVDGSERTQDEFAKPDGTVAINITGDPKNSPDIYAISYAKFARPLSPAAMATLNQRTVKCN